MIILWTKCIVKTKNEYTYKVSQYTYISTEYLWCNIYNVVIIIN